MTVQELHVKVNQRYQEVASNKRDTFFPEEIDLALTTALDRFVSEKIAENDMTSLQPLIVRGYNVITRHMVATTEITASFGTEENTSYALIPASLLHLIDTRATVITNLSDCST